MPVRPLADVVIRRFEEIEDWREARALATKVYEVSNQGRFIADFGLRDQIRRASVSIMANIAEGFGRGGKAEFIRFLRISRASELEQFESLHKQAVTVTRLVGGFINYLSQRTDQPKTNQPNNRV